jgi:hypothetical protein
MTRRRLLWTICAFVPSVALALAALSAADGSFRSPSTTATIAANAAGTAARSASGGGQLACSFIDPCSPEALLPDSIARARLSAPASPNPNSCWYCLVHGTADTYTPWYIGVDYASPVATLSVVGGQAPEPVLTVTGNEAVAVLVNGGYDLAYSSRITGFVCVFAATCPSAPTPMSLTPGLKFSMSGPASSMERWEIVPVIAERDDAHTDNVWYRLGEKRSSMMQKVVIGFQEVVFS